MGPHEFTRPNLDLLVDLKQLDLAGQVVLGGLKVLLRGGQLLLRARNLVLGCVQVVHKAFARCLVRVGQRGNVGPLALLVRLAGSTA